MNLLTSELSSSTFWDSSNCWSVGEGVNGTTRAEALLSFSFDFFLVTEGVGATNE